MQMRRCSRCEQSPGNAYIHAFLYVQKTNSFIENSLRQVCSKLDISIQNCIIRNASVHTERYPRPITVLHTNYELLTFSEKLRIDEEDAVLWLTHASFFKRRFKKTNKKNQKTVNASCKSKTALQVTIQLCCNV